MNWIREHSNQIALAIIVLFGVILGTIAYYGLPFRVQVRMPESLTLEQCQIITSLPSFYKTVTKTDCCTHKDVTYFIYKISWKSDIEGWLQEELNKVGIEPISIEEYKP